MNSTPSRHHARPIQPGDYVSCADENGVVRWGTALTSVLNDGPWPEIRVRVNGAYVIRTVPARDVQPARRRHGTTHQPRDRWGRPMGAS
jgi:hypothetical protein